MDLFTSYIGYLALWSLFVREIISGGWASYKYVDLNRCSLAFTSIYMNTQNRKLRWHAHVISQGPTNSGFRLPLTLPITTLAETAIEIIGLMIDGGTITEDYIGNIK